jgi:hypothetical protein
MFKTLANYDEEDGKTRIVYVDEFVGEYANLKLGNGGSLSRKEMSFSRSHKIVKVKANGAIEYQWEASEQERLDAELKVKTAREARSVTHPTREPSGNKIVAIFSLGKLKDTVAGRGSISPKICKHHKSLPCAFCGTRSHLECDHKNALYNNPRVNNPKTQTIDDFQSTCKHCNDVKREVNKRERHDQKREPASNVPLLRPLVEMLGIPEYHKGDETLDMTDPDAMFGSYYYDPTAFMKNTAQWLKDERIRMLEEHRAENERLHQMLEEQQAEIERLRQMMQHQATSSNVV